MEKKIATSVEVLIKVAQYESIRVTKYGESKIEYDSPDEMVKKENELNDQVIDDLIRSLKGVPEKFPKSSNCVVDIGEKIEKKIPEWLENGAEPNISNGAKKAHEKSDGKTHVKVEKVEEKKNEENEELNDLFGDTEEKKEEPTTTEAPKTEEKTTTGDLDFREDGDDLFA